MDRGFDDVPVEEIRDPTGKIGSVIRGFYRVIKCRAHVPVYLLVRCGVGGELQMRRGRTGNFEPLAKIDPTHGPDVDGRGASRHLSVNVWLPQSSDEIAFLFAPAPGIGRGSRPNPRPPPLPPDPTLANLTAELSGEFATLVEGFAYGEIVAYPRLGGQVKAGVWGQGVTHESGSSVEVALSVDGKQEVKSGAGAPRIDMDVALHNRSEIRATLTAHLAHRDFPQLNVFAAEKPF